MLEQAEDRLIGISEVRRLVPVAPSTLNRWLDSGYFPPPIPPAVHGGAVPCIGLGHVSPGSDRGGERFNSIAQEKP